MSRLTIALSLAAAVALVGVAIFVGSQAVGAPAASTDWPQWRGVHRDANSAETGLLKAWPKEGPPLLWKMEGMGKGLSGIAIVGATGYTTGDIDEAECIVAVDLATQKVLWSTKVGRNWPGGPQGPGAHCVPTVDGDMLYVTTPNGDVAAVTTAGKPVWSKNFKSDFGGQLMSGWGYSESPLVDGDKVIVTPGAKTLIVALNKKTGEEIWKSPAGEKAGYASCIISEGGGVRQYVTNTEKGLVSVEAKTGKVLWRNGTATKGTANIPTPIARGDFVYGSNGYEGGGVLVKLSADGAGGVKAEEIKSLPAKTFQNHHGGMVLVGDCIYAGSGQNAGKPTCIDFKTGEVKWQEQKAPADGSAAVMAADGCVYTRYEGGLVVLSAASPDGYKELGRFTPPVVNKPAWAHPVISNGKLYLRDQNTLMCYDIKAK
jgi:outer membrane protein assembly factor BamB